MFTRLYTSLGRPFNMRFLGNNTPIAKQKKAGGYEDLADADGELLLDADGEQLQIKV